MTEIDLKEIWQSQKRVALDDASVIVAKAKRFQKKAKIKILLGNLLLLATLIFIISIFIYYEPKMITTKIGIGLICLAITMQIIASSKLFLVLQSRDLTTNSADYLNQFVLFKKKQAFVQTTIIKLYFIFLSVGLLLYMIEYTQRGSWIWILSIYGSTTLWIAFNWFYVRPKTIQKQEAKWNEMISTLERYQEQLFE